MPCQDEALDALIAFDEENEGDPAAFLSLLVAAQSGALPADCLSAAGLGALIEAD